MPMLNKAMTQNYEHYQFRLFGQSPAIFGEPSFLHMIYEFRLFGQSPTIFGEPSPGKNS
jgi:hypothetical protein